MKELDRFTDPDDWYGLRSWRYPKKSRLLGRLMKLHPRKTIPPRRGFNLLRDFFGEVIERTGSLELEYAYQRLLTLDWLSGFGVLKFFSEEEIRSHALLYGPPSESVLGHFWYGLLEREAPGDIERIYLRRETVRHKAYRGFRVS